MKHPIETDHLKKKQSALEAAAVFRQSTKGRYKKVLSSFDPFAFAFGVDISGTGPNTIEEGQKLDMAALEWADEQYFEGVAASQGDLLFSAIKDLWPAFGVGGHLGLPRFRRARRGWQNLRPGLARDPLIRQQLVILAEHFAVHREKDMGLYVLTCFTGYLRPGEGLELEKQDLLEPTKECPSWSLNLHPWSRGKPSKTGVFDAGVMLASDRRPWLGPALKKHMSKKKDNDQIFDLTY